MTLVHKQKVVLREKVRRARQDAFKLVFKKFFKFLSFAFLIIGGIYSLHYFLFQTDFFMIKSIEVEPQNGKMTSQIMREVLPLKMQSILNVSTHQSEQNLKEKFPAISSLKVSRSLPNQLKIVYRLRVPIASIKNGQYGVDEEGVAFSLTNFWNEQGEISPLPELVFSSTASLSSAVGFLKMWSSTRSNKSSEFSTSSVHKITIDDNSEIVLYRLDPKEKKVETQIVWGNFDPENFLEKFNRFQRVWTDLETRSLQVRTVNLREAIQKNDSVLNDHKVVGRVVVHPTHFTSEVK